MDRIQNNPLAGDFLEDLMENGRKRHNERVIADMFQEEGHRRHDRDMKNRVLGAFGKAKEDRREREAKEKILGMFGASKPKASRHQGWGAF